MHIIVISEKRGQEFEGDQRGVGIQESLLRGKGREKCCNHILITKIKIKTIYIYT